MVVSCLPGLGHPFGAGLLDALRGWAGANEARVQLSTLAPDDFINNRFSVFVQSAGAGTAAPFIARRAAVVLPGLAFGIAPRALVAEVDRLYRPLADAARLVPSDVLFDLIDGSDWGEAVHPGPGTDPVAFARLRADLSAACREWRDRNRAMMALSDAHDEFCRSGCPEPAEIEARFEEAAGEADRARRRFWEIVEEFQGPRPVAPSERQ